MNMWEAIVVIVVVASFAKVLRIRYLADAGFGTDRHGNTVIGAAPRNEDAIRETEALRRELRELTERVQVLERIATDNRHSEGLAAEIEALRAR